MLIKYPRTLHLPGSPGATNDDKVLDSLDCFKDKPLVVTVKMDGENTTMTKYKCYARSTDSMHHKSRSWVKELHGRIAYEIPEHWRICGENMYAKHSIYYSELPSYFLVFNIWNSFNECLSWHDTKKWCDTLGLSHVQDLYDIVDLEFLTHRGWPTHALEGHEGFVIRNADLFPYQDFSKNVAKWVRANHVTENRHWRHSKLDINKLAINEQINPTTMTV